MFAPHIRGRRRALDQQKKVELCDLVHHGATVEEAADTIGVSLRTVQREAKLDEDFDHELKLALGGAPDPLKLMQRAARAHWRAAAWLLERTDPEHYARRPKSSASPEQFEGALRFMLEAALEATPPEARSALYQRLHAAREQAFASVFPNYGPWGRPKNPKLPPTPLTNQEHLKSVRDTSSRFHVYDKAKDPVEAPAPLALWEASPTPMTLTTSSDSAPPQIIPSTDDRPTELHPADGHSAESHPTNEEPTSAPSAPEGRSHVARGASPWTKRDKRRKPQRGGVAPALRNPRSIKPRRPNVSRDDNRVVSPKTRITTKRTPNDAPPNKTPVSREAVAERERQRGQTPSEPNEPTHQGALPSALAGSA